MNARLLVISPPCHQPVNRAVYHELAARHGIPVRLVVPRHVCVGRVWHDTPPGEALEAYELVVLDFKGTHGRLHRIAAFDKATLAWRPTHILVDSDPASLLAHQAITTFPDAKAWVMTAENLAPRYRDEFSRGLKALKFGRMLAPLVVYALRSWIHPKVDRVFTLSTDGTSVMETFGLTATQIPLGFDPTLFRIQDESRRSATRTRIGLNRRTVAYFGRQTPEKGVHLLVEALSGLKHLEWQFLIDRFSVYGGSYVENLRRLIEASGIAERVVYFDARHEEMPDYMNASDIVVLPSVSTPKWKEQYGRVIPEAMACGRAVIGSDSGAIPELIAGFGEVFPEGDVLALRGSLEKSLTATDLAERGKEASIYAFRHLSITRQAEILACCLTS